MRLTHRPVAQILREVKTSLDTGDDLARESGFCELACHPEVRRVLRAASPQLRGMLGTENEQVELVWE